MTTLNLTAAHSPQVRAIPGLARLGAFFKLIGEVYSDAQKSMREANRKYPYAGI